MTILVTLLGLPGCREKRETIFDRVVSIPKELVLDVPYLPPLCDELSGLKKGFVDIPGGKLYYEEEGYGVPLVLINGGPGGTHHGFHPYFSQLKDCARVIYYDQRGTGQSSMDPTGKYYTIRQAVEDLEYLRTHLKIDRWVVLGWSYGGLLAQCYALTYPEACSGLILVATETGGIIQYRKREQPISELEWDAIASIRKVAQKGEITSVQCIYNTLLAGDWKSQYYFKPTRKTVIRQARYNWKPDEWGASSGFAQLMRPQVSKMNLKGKFDNFEIPTLIMEAQYDMLLWQEVDRDITLRTNYSHAQLELFKQSGHTIFADETDKFFAIVRTFLKKAGNSKIVYKPGHRIVFP